MNINLIINRDSYSITTDKKVSKFDVIQYHQNLPMNIYSAGKKIMTDINELATQSYRKCTDITISGTNKELINLLINPEFRSGLDPKTQMNKSDMKVIEKLLNESKVKWNKRN